MDAIIYFFGLVFLAFYFFQGAVTGGLRRGRGRSVGSVWPIPNWGRLACLLIGSGFTVAASS